LGYKRPGMLEHWPEHLEGLEQLKARLAAPTLRDAFHQFLVGCGAEIPQDILERDVTQPSQPDERVQEALFQLYTDRPDLIGMFETMIDLDEGFMEWRYRHVQLVSRTIGTKEGTGGSLGVEFLKKSLFHPFFPDLWAIRHRF
jgi:tryptophan 2,3-dioxygenase